MENSNKLLKSNENTTKNEERIKVVLPNGRVEYVKESEYAEKIEEFQEEIKEFYTSAE